MRTPLASLFALRSILIAAALTLVALLPARTAEEQAAPLTPALLDAIVRVETQIPPDARTAPYLGTEREGSGVVIDADGLIVTIGYLVMEAMAAQVTGPDGKKVLASVVGFDNDSGLGLLRANEKLGVKPLRLGSASGLREKTVALVASANDARPVVVTSRRSFAGYWEYLLEDAIFTAPAFEDWGGAALIGEDGKLLGIGSLLVPNATNSAEPHPGNMFVPIDLLEPVLADLLTGGRPSAPARPWLGLNLAPSGDGLVVMRVSADSPAKKAGIARGDRVLAVAGQPIRDLADFYRKVWAQGAAGVNVPLTVEHESMHREVTVPSADRYRYLKLNTSY